MACSCNKDNGEFVISPYDFCNYCAEKHLSTAYGLFNEVGLKFPSRQLIIGDLRLFEMHQNADCEIVVKISAFREKLQNRSEVSLSEFNLLLQEFNRYIGSEIVKEKSSKISMFHKRSIPHDNYDYQTPNLKIAELNFCVAWRLADECGYENINRNVMIERLTVSQLKSYKLEYEIAKDIRDIRHLVQHRKENEIGDKWINVAERFDITLNKTE